ncbi:MAG: hypothetical protein AB7F38_03850 [Piscinibacter sp.]
MHAVLKLLTLGAWRPGRSRQPARPAGSRRVWRITDSHPAGTWVDPDAPPDEPVDEASTLPMGSWTTSSMDLLDGVQVVEIDDPESGHPKPH